MPLLVTGARGPWNRTPARRVWTERYRIVSCPALGDARAVQREAFDWALGELEASPELAVRTRAGQDSLRNSAMMRFGRVTRDDDVLVGADVVLESVHHHRLARTNGTADRDQAPRPDGREHILSQLAKALGLEVSSVHPMRDDPEAAHDLGGQHSLVPSVPARTSPENGRFSDARSKPRAAAVDGVIRSDCEYEPMIASTSHAM